MQGFDPIQNRRRLAESYSPIQPLQPQSLPEESITGKIFKAEKSFAGKIGINTVDTTPNRETFGDFALNTTLAIPAAVVGIPAELAKDVFTGQFAKAGKLGWDVGTGVLKSFFVDPFNIKLWKERPYSQLFNLALNATVIGGVAKGVILSSAKTLALNAVKEAAIKAGAESAMVDVAFQSPKLFGKIPNILKGDIFKQAMNESVKLKSAAPFETTLRPVLSKLGLAEDVVNNIVKIGSDSVGKFLIDNAGKLGKLDMVINPLKVFGKLSPVTKPIQEMILGKSSDAAVNTIFKPAEVATDLKSAGLFEEWLTKKVESNGLKPTLENKVKEFYNEVDSNPDFAAAEGFVGKMEHFNNYQAADIPRFNLAKSLGQEIVTSKVLPVERTNSFVEFVNKLPKELTNNQVIQEVSKQFGKLFSNHIVEVTKNVGTNLEKTNRTSLIKSIEDLSKRRILINLKKLTPEQLGLVKEMEVKGYLPAKAPKGKIITQAAELGKQEIKTSEEFMKVGREEQIKNFNSIGKGHKSFSDSLDVLEKNKTLSSEDTTLLREIFKDTEDKFLSSISVEDSAYLKRGGIAQYYISGVGKRTLKIKKGISDILETKLSENDRKFWSRPDAQPSVVFLHEYGHLAHRFVLSDVEKQIVSEVFNDLKKSGRVKFFQEGLSGVSKPKVVGHGEYYYAKNAKEFLAESFAEYVMGNKVPTLAMKPLLQRLLQKFSDALLRMIKRNTPKQVERLNPIFEKMISGDKESVLSRFIDEKPINFKENLKSFLESGDNIPPISEPISGISGGIESSTQDLLSYRTFLGRVIDNIGLSLDGKVTGTERFLFDQAFTNGLRKVFGEGGTVIIDKIKYPIDTLSYQLDRFRQLMASKQDVFKKVLTPFARDISKLREKDLIKIGFEKADAIKVEKVIRESSITSPSVVGLGEAVSNYFRSQNNYLSRSYNTFMNIQVNARFRLSFMYGGQAWFENLTWTNLMFKTSPLDIISTGKRIVSKLPEVVKKTLPLPERTVDAITRFAEKQFPSLKTPLMDANRVGDMAKQEFVSKNFLGDFARQSRDLGSTPEISRSLTPETRIGEDVGVSALNRRLDLENRASNSNIISGVESLSDLRGVTNASENWFKKFGLDWEEATKTKIVNGKEVFVNQWLMDSTSETINSVLGYKYGILTSPFIRTLNTIWFPARFQTKTLMQTVEWLGGLNPTARLLIVNDWMATSNWLNTDEGKKWKNGNRGTFASIFNYVFAFESIGKSVDAVTRGQLFGGGSGQIGGLPFGFIYSIARDLGHIPQDVEMNPATGKPYQRKVVKESVSFPAFVTAVEDVVLAMSPTMPLYLASGGKLTVSSNRFIKDMVDQSSAIIYSTLPGKTLKEAKKEISSSKKNVKPGYYKKLPISQ